MSNPNMASETKPKFTNRLAQEKSPYLLQHAHNPVNWFPWTDEAFMKAQQENKMILLSIGYSTCHWCHVMERESFENEAIADQLNEDFVCIKVDREERPDVDAVYMQLAQALNGGGGWPLNVFLRPDKVPFFSGTYFPPEDKWGRAGLPTVLNSLVKQWKEEPERIHGIASQVQNFAKEKASEASGKSSPSLSSACIDLAISQKTKSFDGEYGGFSVQPKFPMGHSISFLIQQYHFSRKENLKEMAELTLTKMAQGGIFDQLGGGFHRYSVDREWLVPHFEKMLYDQALLLQAYAEAYQVDHNPYYAKIAYATAGYLKRDLRHSGGAFFSGEDADSEGEEGLFYLWDLAELHEILGAEAADLASHWWGLSPQGNFEGKNILIEEENELEFAKARNLTVTQLQEKLAHIRSKLLEKRSHRIRPHRDDKILCDWNGLVISGLCRVARAIPQLPQEARFQEEQIQAGKELLQMAEEAAHFVLQSLRPQPDTLLKSWREGPSRIVGLLEDYAFFVNGLIDLFEVSGKTKWLKEAILLAQSMKNQFWDAEGGGFRQIAREGETLLFNPCEAHDGAIPSGNSIAALLCLRLAAITEEKQWTEVAEACLQKFSSELNQYPAAHCAMLSALDRAIHSSQELVLCIPEGTEASVTLLDRLRQQYLPRSVLILKPEAVQKTDGQAGDELLSLAPALRDKIALNGQFTLYVCENYACQAPWVGEKEILSKLESLR